MSVVNGAPDPFFTGLHKCRYHFTQQRRDFCDKVLAIGNAIVDIHISVFAQFSDFLPKVVISDFYSPTAFSSINISKLVSIRMLEHVYITGHQGILASKIQIFSFINFSGSSCTKDGIWYVHQPCICTHRRCHLDPAKQKKKN